MQPDGKMSEMGDTSGAVAYLLSTDSKYVNAHSLTVGLGMENYLMNPAAFTGALDKTFALMAAQQAAAAEEAK